MTDAAEIVQHYRCRGFRHFELKRKLLRHARLLRLFDPVVARELRVRANGRVLGAR